MIAIKLRILLIITSALFFIMTVYFIRKKRLSIKYSLCWIAASALLLLVGAIPAQIGAVTRLIGFETTSNFVIGLLLIMLFLISFILMLIVSKQKKTITLLIQEISILEKTVKEVKSN
ncbi:MAG: DUF2304 domain-containing protein [Treponemataceae bacterium]|nr:DUF2304 domain-containing protein [Treponemataceae bacterium]